MYITLIATIKKEDMAKKIDRFEHNPGMGMLLSYILLFAVSFLTVSFIANLFPKQIVLGTLSITRNWALIYSMIVLALVTTFSMPLVKEWEHRQKRTLSDKGWMVTYLIINFIGLWCIGRQADQLGLGFASWKAVLGLAVVLDLVQGMAMMVFEKWKMAN